MRRGGEKVVITMSHLKDGEYFNNGEGYAWEVGLKDKVFYARPIDGGKKYYTATGWKLDSNNVEGVEYIEDPMRQLMIDAIFRKLKRRVRP